MPRTFPEGARIYWKGKRMNFADSRDLPLMGCPWAITQLPGASFPHLYNGIIPAFKSIEDNSHKMSPVVPDT